MSRLIDGDALMPKLKFIQEAEHQIYGKESWGFASKCITAIEDAPTIEERLTGEWIVSESEEVGSLGIRYRTYTCPSCGWDNSLIIPRNFCPNCGCRLNGGK